MSEMFGDIEDVEVVVDDLLIWGTTEEQHDSRLENVLQRARQHNLKLNKDKSQIKQKEVRYIIGEDGIKPDPRKVTAVTEMKPPETKEELQRFLCMTNYLSKFIPNYSETLAPLRVLLEKDTSSKGMGAVLLQDQRPIAYASKSLTATQQNYAEIEKEMLAIVFGCQKVVFWPGMGAQIEDIVSSCSTCSKLQRKNTKEPLLPHSHPRDFGKELVQTCVS